MTEIRYIDGIRDAIAAAPEGDPLFVENFIVIATVTTPDGVVEIHTLSDVDLAWQTLGMLHHAILLAEQQDREDEL